MRRLARLLRPALVGLALCLCLASTHAREAAATTAGDAALAQLERAAADHPDDPDLAFALARRLADSGHGPEAVARANAFVARWPALRPEARLEIARTLVDAGAPADAQMLLEVETRENPRSAMAHFYRGIALRATHDPMAAQQAFQAAAHLEPALRSETLLIRALMLFDLERDDEAVALLDELLRIDPTSDTAVRARLLLRDHEVARGRQRLRAHAVAGFEWDENVTLEGSESETLASERSDWRGVWGAGLSGQPWLAERGGLLLGYRYDQTHHAELSDYDLIQNALFASLSLQPFRGTTGRRFALRFDGQGYDTIQDLDRVLTGGAFRPSLLHSFGPKAGVLRGFALFELAEFRGGAQIEPWKRDALAGGLGLEHTLPLGPRIGTLAASFSWQRSITEAEPGGNSDQFDGDFDHDSLRVRALGNFVLPWSLRAQVEAVYFRDAYLNDNFANWLDTLDLEKRTDDVLSGRVALSRPVAPHTRLELYWRGASRASNVALFDYDKQLVGFLLHVSTD